MIMYEYKVVDLSLLGGTDSVIAAFNEQGVIGWELVSVMGGLGYFKRSSNNGFDSTNASISTEDSSSMTIITTANVSGEEVPLEEQQPPKRRIGRPPREDRQVGVLLAEDSIMPAPESIQ